MIQFEGIEIFFEEIIVAVGCGFHEHFAVIFNIVFQFGGNIDFFGFAFFIGISFHFHDIHNTGEGFAGADGNLYGNDVHGESASQRFQRFIEIGVFSVHSVDENETRGFFLIGFFPDQFGADLSAGNGVYDHKETVGNTKAAFYIAVEIHEAGSIQQVNFAIFMFKSQQRGADRNFLFRFFGEIVGNTVSFVYFTETGKTAGIVDHIFGH